jgi:hypothetical protein
MRSESVESCGNNHPKQIDKNIDFIQADFLSFNIKIILKDAT